MANRIQSRLSVFYEMTKEDIEAMILPALANKVGESLPFDPNKISVDYSDPGNGVYQIRLELNEGLSRQSVLYELTKEDIEEMVLPALSLPFDPNKISISSDDGAYKVTVEFNEDLPQVLPLRGPGK